MLASCSRRHRARTELSRPTAGFRNAHARLPVLELLMLVSAFESQWFVSGRRTALHPGSDARRSGHHDRHLGFIGAGAISQVRPHGARLTTAASIWMTAAIGVLFGWVLLPAVLASGLTLGSCRSSAGESRCRPRFTRSSSCASPRSGAAGGSHAQHGRRSSFSIAEPELPARQDRWRFESA